MQITREMTDELNAILANMGCSFCLKYKESEMTKMPSVEIVIMNSKFVDSAIINLTNGGLLFVETFFKNKGITLAYNNTRTIMWSINY